MVNNASMRLDLAITFMDPGSASDRLLAGEIGAGHAQLQIECKVIDISNGTLPAWFAERRRSSGDGGLNDLGGDAGRSLIKEMTQNISKDISKELLLTFSEQ